MTTSLFKRLRASLLGWAVFMLVACLWVLPVMAQSTITWDDLQSHSTHLSNPYEQLTQDQTYRLSSLYRLQEWVQENQAAPDSFEAKEVQRLQQSFVDDGLDTDELLSQVDEARAYLQAQSEITNPELEDRAVQLSGYVLPLNANNKTQTVQEVSEFLLVPFVGACIHVPPPPPNQMIYIKPEMPIENPGLFSSVLVTGTIRKQINSYELFQVDGSRTVDVSYAMDMDAIAAAPDADGPQITGSWWKTLPARISGVLTTS